MQKTSQASLSLEVFDDIKRVPCDRFPTLYVNQEKKYKNLQAKAGLAKIKNKDTQYRCRIEGMDAVYRGDYR